MNQVAWSHFRSMTTEKHEELIPCIITKEDVPIYVIERPENIIVLSDLHPRVRNMLRALEKRARFGMPPPAIVTAAKES